jgi:hypothetical protein
MEINEIFNNHGFHCGRMISGSKSGYRERHPKNDVIFNARIFTPKHGNVFWGDLDITLDSNELQMVCNELGEEMIITTESVSWYAEDKKHEDIEKYAHAKFIPESKTYLQRVYDGLTGIQAGNMTIITSKGIDWITKKLKRK